MYDYVTFDATDIIQLHFIASYFLLVGFHYQRDQRRQLPQYPPPVCACLFFPVTFNAEACLPIFDFHSLHILSSLLVLHFRQFFILFSLILRILRQRDDTFHCNYTHTFSLFHFQIKIYETFEIRGQHLIVEVNDSIEETFL